jgi:hypothetical protein
MKIVATDRKGATREVEGRDGWSVMEILRDAGFDMAGLRNCRRAPMLNSTCLTWHWRSSRTRGFRARSPVRRNWTA